MRTNLIRALSAACRGAIRTAKSSRHNRQRLAVTLLAAIVAAGTLGLLPAAATHTACEPGALPVHFTPPDAALRVWDVEGKITDYSVANRTITANGMTMFIPAGLLVKTNDLDQPLGNIEFAEDANPALLDLVDEAYPTIIGGTVIAGGVAEYQTVGTDVCVKFVADSAFVELAENGLIGPLMEVDAVNGWFKVNGAIVRMNADPRFPSDLVDLGGNPISVADLVGNEGSLMDVGGYFSGGVLYGTAVQAEVLMRQVNRDTVVIEKAQVQRSRLRVVGLASVHPNNGQFAASVGVYTGAMKTDGSGCLESGHLGSAPVDPADGTFDFRTTVSAAPSQVCVSTLWPAGTAGGADDANVVIK